MKRIIALLAACLISISVFAGCGGASPNTISHTENSKVDYSKEFEQIENYLVKKKCITKDMVKNFNDTTLPKTKGVDYKYGYEYIGAISGKKYINNGVVVELYEFKEGENNKTIESVKKNGTFTLYDSEIKAYLTDDEKFMLIYTDKSIKDDDTDSEAYKTMQKTVKAFEEYNPDEEKTEETKETEKSTTSKSETTKSKTESKKSQ